VLPSCLGIGVRKPLRMRLSDKEAKSIAAFRKKHYESCNNAGKFLFELVGTGIGEAISIRCPVCGAEENVTDYSNW